MVTFYPLTGAYISKETTLAIAFLVFVIVKNYCKGGN